MFLAPPDGPGVVYEFFSPFAHVEGRIEWCRIRSPTHGVFDTLILLDPRGTGHPASVYVASEAGERFMRERYPECAAFRLPFGALSITEAREGRTVTGKLRATMGPLREADMSILAEGDARPEQVPYGGKGEPVWGSKQWTCWGVDLALRARATGRLAWADGRIERVDEPAILTLGSFGRIAPLQG